MLRLTVSQSAKVNMSIRQSCANYDADGNCLQLSDNCPQTQSFSLICKYYRNNVLPADKQLYAELYGNTGGMKECTRCKRSFSPKSNRAKYCPECAAKAKQESNRERQQKHRSHVTL